jgi:ribonuclease HII
VDKIQIDGRDNYIFEDNDIATEYIIKWDTKIDEIKAASIIAKVTRDALMNEYALKFPWYHFELHSWYWTKKHQEAINRLWICPIHRTSYKPVKNALILEQKAIQSANNT